MAVFTFMSMGYLVFNEGHITIEVHKLIKNHKALAIVEIVMYVVMIVFPCSTCIWATICSPSLCPREPQRHSCVSR